MSVAIPEPEIGGANTSCTWNESRGRKEHIIECEGTPGVFWDLISDGEFNWEVPQWNIVGDLERVGDEVKTGNLKRTGYIDILPISNPGPPPVGVRLFTSANNNHLIIWKAGEATPQAIPCHNAYSYNLY